MITQLLERKQDPWLVTTASMADLPQVISRNYPDGLIVDAVDFPRCCGPDCGGFPMAQVVVIGRDPDRAYRTEALRAGAGAWVAADSIGDELSEQLDAVFVRGLAVNTDR